MGVVIIERDGDDNCEVVFCYNNVLRLIVTKWKNDF